MELKRKQAEYPFDDYWLYIILHKKQNRYMANLIHKTNKTRTTFAYSKYLMCVNLKRILSRDEQVDHIDGNKLNDAIENLQILTSAENLRKMVIETGKSAIVYDLLCTECNISFKRKRVGWKIAKGLGIFCSKLCQYNNMRKVKIY